MTIDDFKIGALVEHNEWGDGKVIANNNDKIAVEFINGIRLFFSCTDDLYHMSTLKIKQFKE